MAADFFIGKQPPTYSTRSGIEIQIAEGMALECGHG
jgi:hypothetical protein